METRKLALLVLLVLVFPLANAAVFINELVPNPTDDCLDCTEWLELYNSGSEDVDVSGWVLNDSTDHYIYINSNYSTAGTVVRADDYLVLSDFSYGFRLRNKEDIISLFDGYSLVDEVSYSGFSTKASSDKSWSRVPDGSDGWIKGESTRGVSNGAADEPEDEEDLDGDVDDELDVVEPDNSGVDAESGTDLVEESVTGGEESGEKLTGRTVYVSDDKSDLTKPLLLLLLGLIIVAIVMQLQLVSRNERNAE